MSAFDIDEGSLHNSLHGKTVVVTGASQGIGKATVEILVRHGANVVFGDVLKEAGEALASELGDHVVFLPCDVSKWADLVHLFKTARQMFGDIHAVAANAGIIEQGDMFNDDLDANGDLAEFSYKVVDVNLLGVLNTVRLAMHHFKRNSDPGGNVVLLGSAASYVDTPPLWAYTASKHGVLGLMRALRSRASRWNVRVNVVTPWMTMTAMARSIDKIWGDLPRNTPEAVGQLVAYLCGAREVNGKSFWCAGNKYVEVEERLEQLWPEWLTDELACSLQAGQALVNSTFEGPDE
mmetsp:Transcript_83672/g.237364  ORF Transcript_83672/g.237364 Transcript_83672/m.237364 type:complete len:293 (+) Transcript_83672:53-931(+)